VSTHDRTATTTRDDEVPAYDTPDGRPPAEADRPRQRHPFEDLPLEEDGMPSTQDLRNGLRAVVDPEIGYNIVDLGLVYEVTKPERGYAHVLMTLTSMGCPLTELIHQQCTMILTRLPGVEHVEVDFVFTPPWTTDMISDEAREELRAMGFNV